MLVFVVFEELINQSSDRNNTCIVNSSRIVARSLFNTFLPIIKRATEMQK